MDQKKEVAKYRKELDAPATGMAIDYQPGETLTLEAGDAAGESGQRAAGDLGENYLQGLIEKDRAAAIFLPTVALEPAYTVTDRANAGTGGAVGTIGGFRPVGSTLRRFEAPVVSRVNLFNGFGDVARLRARPAPRPSAGGCCCSTSRP